MKSFLLYERRGKGGGVCPLNTPLSHYFDNRNFPEFSVLNLNLLKYQFRDNGSKYYFERLIKLINISLTIDKTIFSIYLKMILEPLP